MKRYVRVNCDLAGSRVRWVNASRQWQYHPIKGDPRLHLHAPWSDGSRNLTASRQIPICGNCQNWIHRAIRVKFSKD